MYYSHHDICEWIFNTKLNKYYQNVDLGYRMSENLYTQVEKYKRIDRNIYKQKTCKF